MAGYNFSREPKEVPLVETKNRKIHTAIPCPGTVDILEKLERVESRSMQGQYPIVWSKAQGHNVYDLADNKWIDFTSTIFVTNTGHGNENIINAIKEVLDKPLLHTYAYTNVYRADYLEYLLEVTPPQFEKAFLMSAGTEATDAALKLIRLNAQKRNKKPYVICIEGNWHGRTMGAQLLSSSQEQKAWIGHEDPYIKHIPFPYLWNVSEDQGAEFFKESLKALEEQGIDIKNDVAGFMLETFQGWGACYYPKSYVKEIEKVCKANDILLCFDEMQAGFGRTGKLFGYQNYEVEADLLCLGKGMGGGVPVSGVLSSKEIMDLPDVGEMSSTHSANPIVCSAAHAVLKELVQGGLIEKSEMLGKIFHEKLNEIKNEFSENISYISGTGLLAAVIFKKENGEADKRLPSIVSELCLQKGLLVVHTGRESIKLAPPLSITKDALLEGVEVLKQSIIEALRNG